jgi:hypothetical protein
MGFMKPKVDRAVETMRNDPDIKKKFKDLEHALQDLKDATEREEEFRNSDQRDLFRSAFGFKK